jgi:hypothetical protein
MATKSSASTTITLPAIAEPKKGGIGIVYKETTNAVSEIFGTVGELAAAGRILGQNAVAQAAMARIETSQEILKTLGVESSGVEAMVAADHLVKFIRNSR